MTRAEQIEKATSTIMGRRAGYSEAIAWIFAEIRRLDAENERLRAGNMRLMEENGRLRFEAKYGTNELEVS